MKEPNDGPVHDLAGGWISERSGTKVPGFLKLSYVAFSLFGVAYLFLWKSGETGHATRGTLVRELNSATEPLGAVWLGVIALLLGGYVLWLFRAGFSKVPDDE
jgi:hypothetical protein